MLMSDHGLVLYGNAIMVNPDYAKANPKVVAGFVRATIKGVLDTIKDPDAAIKSVMKRNDTGDEKIELDRLKMSLRDNFVTPWVKANGFGDVDMARLAKSIDQIALTYDFKNRPKAAGHLHHAVSAAGRRPEAVRARLDALPHSEGESMSAGIASATHACGGELRCGDLTTTSVRHGPRSAGPPPRCGRDARTQRRTGTRPTPSVDIDDVTLTYKGASGGVLALQGTTLNVRSGEFAAVVGPSGCGKSSLMKLVTGLVPPDSGDIVIFGDKVRGPVKIAGMAFQNPNLLPWRKVIDNVLLPLEIVRPHRQRFRQAQGGVSRTGQRAAQDRRARRLRRALSVGTLRRHAAARLALPRADPRAGAADARRAVRRARCLHARGIVVRAARPLAEAAASPSSWSRTICARRRFSPTTSTS